MDSGSMQVYRFLMHDARWQNWSKDTVADPELQIRQGGGGGHLDPEIRGEGGGGLKKNVVTAVITDTVHLAISSDVVIHFTHPIL